MKDEKQYRDDIYLKAKNDYDTELKENQITMCIVTEENEGLSFFHNQIWPAPRNGAIKWEKTIDGYRVLAQRNGLCKVSKPNWIYDENFTHTNKNRMGPGGLHSCEISIWRRSARGHIEGPFVGVAHYHEFVQLKKNGEVNRTWKTMPKNQLAAAAERQALRKAGLDHTTDVISEIVDTEPSDVPSDEPPVVDDPDSSDYGAHSSDSRADVEPPQDARKLEGVSIPSDGWQVFDLLDDGRRIMRIGSKGDVIKLALDDGHALEVKKIGDNRGTIFNDRVRKDANKVPPGGYDWKEGSKYYDGAAILKVKPAKQEGCLIMKLDNGYKVKLGQFGKELSRKELKKKDDVDSKNAPEEKGSKKEGPTITDEERGALDLVRGGTHDITDTTLKKHIRPLLARWCKEFNDGVRVSPKEGYEKLTGVVLEKGQSMQSEDLVAFIETLVEQLGKVGVK